MALRALSLAAFALFLGCAALHPTKNSSPTRVSEVRYVMGTLLDVTLYAATEEEGRKALNETFGIAEHLDGVLSLWKSESPATAFNRDTNTALTEVDPLLYEVVQVSQRLSAETEGAYNISVRPLVDIWENAAKSSVLPSTTKRRQTAQLLGRDAIIVSAPHQLGKRLPGVKIETGGIGKGFAVDKMVALLRERGISSAFINFGRSSIAAIGTPPGEDGWPVELELAERSSEGRLVLRDETLSVSRARGNSIVVSGVAYAHIFDPALGQPVAIVRGAAVRSPSATDGEAYVKYLVIRGEPSTETTKKWNAHEWIVRSGDVVSRGSLSKQ